MAEETAKVVVDETPTAAEKEEQVLESAGIDTKADDGVYKVDLSKPKQQEDALQQEEQVDEQNETNEQVGNQAEEELQKVNEEVEEDTALELIEDDADISSEPEPVNTDETVTEEEVIEESEKNNIDLPENIQKVVDFMNETGGTLEDYVRLNADYSNVDPSTLLKEYYKQTKSHLDNEEIDFLIEDNFSYDEDMDEERDIRRKKLAYKEEIAKAKNFLEGLKEKYYDEVKLGSKLAPEQQKAIDFFNRYNEEQSELQKTQEQQVTRFKQETEKVFNQDFKGFDFKVGDNKYRFKVKDVAQTKELQSDLNNVLNKFLDENNMIADAAGYHKAIFAANNADSLANHFYEQGRADAIKQISNDSKNINMDPRKSGSGVIESGGIKVRAIAGDDSSKLKIKLRK
jgi:hypothetical protein